MVEVIRFAFSETSFDFTLLGINDMYLLSFYFIDGTVGFDILFLRKPVTWLIEKVKGLFKK